MNITMTRLILYVGDPQTLKAFYQSNFGFGLVEEIPGEWVVLDAGGIQLALHKAGEAFRAASPDPRGSSNAKLVLSVDAGLPELRERLLLAGVAMREIKRYAGFPFVMCDGVDPEGNVFQLSQND